MSENYLRPTCLAEYIGQEAIKKQLGVSIAVSKKVQKTFPHVLFHGGAGLGKTSLASVVAKEMDVKVTFANGANIARPADLLSYIVSLNDGDFLFIDEIHRLKKEFQEMLYTAMEDGRVDIVISEGTDAKPISLTLPPFTLLGATTMSGRLSDPLLDRFGLNLALSEYTIDELCSVIKGSLAKINDVHSDHRCAFSDEAIVKLANSSRGAPRKANKILTRIWDFAVAEELDEVDCEFVESVLDEIQIFEGGLDIDDIKIMRFLVDHFDGEPAGLSLLASTTGLDKDTIQNNIEPYLLKNGYIKRTARGRVSTEKASTLLGKVKSKGNIPK
jgi:Holliday junction DNA helicase RuvB